MRCDTLYVSDLDGTLLGPGSRLDARSTLLLDKAISRGTAFTVATARTPATVEGLLAEVAMPLPAVVMTGAAMWTQQTGRFSDLRLFSEDSALTVAQTYRRLGIPSFHFTTDGRALDIFLTCGSPNALQRQFMAERAGNRYKRFHLPQPGLPAPPPDLRNTILFYTMIPDADARAGFEAIRGIPGVRAQYYHDIFGPETGILEAFDASATKANSVKRLAGRIGARRIVAFGDNLNDLPLFEIADTAVAPDNALPEVKAAATIVVGPNSEASVAEYIEADTRP